MRPSSQLCILLFGTRAQDYTSPDDCPACWVTKACTFICAYFPPNLLLPTSAGGQEVLLFTAASWENKGSSGTALKGSGARKEKWKLMNTLPALSLSFLPCWSPQAGHWTWSLQGLLDVKCQAATHNAGTHSPLLPLLKGSPAQRRETGRHLKICLL